MLVSPDVREQLRALAMFHGGAYDQVLDHVLDTPDDDVKTVPMIFREVVKVGLGQDTGLGHLRLDPALPTYLLRRMSNEEQEATRRRWAEGMKWLTGFLVQQRFREPELVTQLTLLELSNLRAMLRWMREHAAPEEVVEVAQAVETLLAKLDRPKALAEVVRTREQAAGRLSNWSRALFLAESASIDRLLEDGDLPAAYSAAQSLLKRCLDKGEGAYQEATYDIATAHCKLGVVLRRVGSAEEALPVLAEARRRFQAWADAGDTGAERMASAAVVGRGDCLMALGRLDEAVASYQEAVSRFEELSDKRWIAASKVQLGTARLLQGLNAEALKIYAEARDIFTSLKESGSVAAIDHQIGMAHRTAGHYERAEQAYKRSLVVKVQQNNLAGEASSLGELGNLYDDLGRLEEAVKCYRQAADIYIKLRDQRHEGTARGNLARVLIKFQRFDEARNELLRAVDCDKPYGHTSQPWLTWASLYEVERIVGNAEEAAIVRRKAVESYLAYRRAGGQNMSRGAQLCLIAAQAIEQDGVTDLKQHLAQLLETDIIPSDKLMISKLQAILLGERSFTIVGDPDLSYLDAAELQLLLEELITK